MSYGPTLAQYNAPMPGVLVEFATVDPSCQTINITRVQEGRTYPVRGGQNLYAVGGVEILDDEAGFGVPVTYQAAMYTAAGAFIGNTDAGSITLNVTQSWIHQPMSPILAIAARILTSTADAVSYVNPGAVYYPEGSTVGTQIGGQRQGIQGLALGVRVNSAADANTFLSMFGSYESDFPAVLCIRTPPPARLPRTLFAASSGPTEKSGANFTYMTYSLTVSEVQPPSPGVILPLLRREDLDFAYATRGARDAAYATRLAEDTDYSLAGVAGP